jgi:hypothetical protein
VKKSHPKFEQVSGGTKEQKAKVIRYKGKPL